MEIVRLGNEYSIEKEEVNKVVSELYERSKKKEIIESKIIKDTRRRHFTHVKDFF